LETIAIASAKFRTGQSRNVFIAGGNGKHEPCAYGRVENRSLLITSQKDDPDYLSQHGLTAEAVAKDYKVSREDQDEFSYNSHQKAIAAIKMAISKVVFFPSRGRDLPGCER
jgi:acetyl-CoA acyltransferase